MRLEFRDSSSCFLQFGDELGLGFRFIDYSEVPCATLVRQLVFRHSRFKEKIFGVFGSGKRVILLGSGITVKVF